MLWVLSIVAMAVVVIGGGLLLDRFLTWLGRGR